MNLDGLEVHEVQTGCRVRVRVKPSAKQDTVIGVHAGRLKMTVVAAPEKGKANAAVARVLATVLNVATSRVEVVLGFTSSDKTVQISDCSGQELRRRLERMPRFSTGAQKK